MEDITMPTAYKLLNKIASGESDADIIVKKGRKVQDFPTVKNKVAHVLLKDYSLTESVIS